MWFDIPQNNSYKYHSLCIRNVSQPQRKRNIRALERIEETFIRKLLKTSRGCPIPQIYLETGHTPARFEIFRKRLLFLKDILNENPESMIFKFIMIQYKNPTRGDWVSSCFKDLQYLNINLSIEEIQLMKKPEFRNFLKTSIEKKPSNIY